MRLVIVILLLLVALWFMPGHVHLSCGISTFDGAPACMVVPGEAK